VELLRAAEECEGMSGRTLRKIPFLAHANFVSHRGACTVMEYLGALRRAAALERADKAAGDKSVDLEAVRLIILVISLMV